jgi:DNA-binding NarL/FixJ family response regulator
VSRPRLVLADDHRIVAEGLHSLLSARYDVVAVVEDGHALLDAVARLTPDVVIADVTMPGLGGIEATARLAREHPGIRVVILTMHRHEAYARRALEAGALGYVLKVAAPDELVAAVEAALAGRVFVSAQLVSDWPPAARRPGRQAERPTDELTPRQREVLRLLAEGRTAKEIGAVLGISPRTVESHKYEMMRALGIERSAELVQHAVRNGLVDV